MGFGFCLWTENKDNLAGYLASRKFSSDFGYVYMFRIIRGQDKTRTWQSDMPSPMRPYELTRPIAKNQRLKGEAFGA